jgi:hypothetical protein
MQQISFVSYVIIARSQKKIEDLEFPGGWQRPRVLKTKIEDLEIKRGKFSHYVCLYNFRIRSPKNRNFNVHTILNFSFPDQVKLTIKLTSSKDPIGFYTILKQITNSEKKMTLEVTALT